MTVLEFITNTIRPSLQDTLEPYLWSNSELLTYFNETIQDIKSQIPQLFYDYTFFIETKPETQTYFILKPTSNVIVNVYYGTTQLTQLSDELNNPILSNDYGIPIYYRYKDNLLTLFPIPDKNYILKITIKPTFIYTLQDELPDIDLELLRLGIMYRAYTKQDTETFDLKAIQLLQAQYTSKLNMLKTSIVRDKNTSTKTSYYNRGLF